MSDIELSTIIIIASGALSFLSAPLFSLFLIPFAKRIGAIDAPRDDRRMHTKPVARIGGVAVFSAFLIGAAILLAAEPSLWSEYIAALIFGGGVIVLGGLADDIYKLGPWQKMLYQALAALVAVAFGVRISDGLPGALLTVFWCVLLTNAFNLIDGLDGLSSASASFCLFALFSVSGTEGLFYIALLCAVLGFLPLNLRPALLFLGDAGAMLLGFSLAVSSAGVFRASPDAKTALAIIIIFAVPLFDTAFAAIRRMLSGKSPFSPDRKHLHHRLVDAGIPHGRASLFMSLLSGGFSALGATILTAGFSAEALILSILLIFPAASVIIIGKRKKKRDKF